MSVGHVARIFEDAGISTVIIAIKAFQHILTAMSVPRLVVTPYLLGRPIGNPGDTEKQRETILAALELLKKAEQNGSVVEIS